MKRKFNIQFSVLILAFKIVFVWASVSQAQNQQISGVVIPNEPTLRTAAVQRFAFVLKAMKANGDIYSELPGVTEEERESAADFIFHVDMEFSDLYILTSEAMFNAIGQVHNVFGVPPQEQIRFMSPGQWAALLSANSKITEAKSRGRAVDPEVLRVATQIFPSKARYKALALKTTERLLAVHPSLYRETQALVLGNHFGWHQLMPAVNGVPHYFRDHLYRDELRHQDVSVDFALQVMRRLRKLEPADSRLLNPFLDRLANEDPRRFVDELKSLPRWTQSVWAKIPRLMAGRDLSIRNDLHEALIRQSKWSKEVWALIYVQLAHHEPRLSKAQSETHRLRLVHLLAFQKEWPLKIKQLVPRLIEEDNRGLRDALALALIAQEEWTEEIWSRLPLLLKEMNEFFLDPVQVRLMERMVREPVWAPEVVALGPVLVDFDYSEKLTQILAPGQVKQSILPYLKAWRDQGPWPSLERQKQVPEGLLELMSLSDKVEFLEPSTLSRTCQNLFK